MFSRDQGSHLVLSKIFMKLVDMHQGLVWFPTVGTCVIAGPSNKEGHCDITAHTVLLYVLFCLIYMYSTLYVLYILYTVHYTYHTLY